ncbi:MAG: SIMPL domain-containing protein [Alphaproteobacteria bacterium]
MKKTIIWICSVIGCGAVMSLVFNAIESPREIKTVSVTGECITTAVKDKTAITLRVETLDADSNKSVQMATDITREITEILKSMPVEMQTTQFNSYEKTEWDNELHKSVKLGIETTIAIEVSANSVDVIEGVMSKFAGRPNIYSENLRVYTSTYETQKAIEKCMTGAVENARERATALANADSRKIGKLLSVSYGANAPEIYAPRTMNKMVLATASADASGTIMARDSEVSVTVSATFEIK